MTGWIRNGLRLMVFWLRLQVRLTVSGLFEMVLAGGKLEGLFLRLQAARLVGFWFDGLKL